MSDVYGTEYKKPHSVLMTFASTVLICEAFVALLAALVAHGLNQHPRWLIWTAALVLAALFVAACAVLRKPFGWGFGWTLQALLTLYGFLLTPMFFVGLMFAGIWWYAVHTGARLDRERAAWDKEVIDQERAEGTNPAAQEGWVEPGSEPVHPPRNPARTQTDTDVNR